MFIKGRHLCETCKLHDFYVGCLADNEVNEGECCIACDDYESDANVKEEQDE